MSNDAGSDPGATAATLETYQRTLDSISDMVSVIGEDRVYRLVNDAWCRVFGIARSQVLGRRADQVFEQATLNNGRRQAFSRCLDHHEVVHVKDERRLGDGNVRLLESTYYPFGRDAAGQRCVVVVSRDATERDAAHRALSETSALLARTLHATGDAIFASDAEHPDRPLRFVNQQTLRMWGIGAADAEGLTPGRMLEIVGPLFADPERELARIREIIDHNLSCEDRVLLRDGRVLLRRCVAEPAHDEERVVRVWSFRDITLETQAERAWLDHRSEMTALLDAFPGSISVFDEDFNYTFANPRFAARFGRPIEDIVGRPIDEVLGPAQGAKLREVAQAVRHHGPQAFERELQGRVIRITLACTIDRRIGRPRYYAFGIDITEAREAERALLAARNEAERANQAKSQFLSHMSHELRTPLNAILGFAQLLEDDPAASPLRRRHVAEILRGGRHLLDLINDMLDLGRIEAGKLAVSRLPLPLAPLLQECLTLIAPLADERHVRLLPLPAHGFDLVVVGDAIRLKQVLLNLLGNAIKYNRPGGEVAFEREDADSGDRDSGKVRIVVRDSGVGIGIEQQARLFRPFERVLSDAASVEGTGIGLALSRHLMLAMGGTIGVDSVHGVGSRFWIELPLHEAAQSGRAALLPMPGDAAAEPPAGPEASPGNGSKAPLRHVLYIEDNPVNVVLMEAMLAQLPGVVLASEMLPLPGLERARQLLPDLILLDIQLPGMSGLELLRELRADLTTRHIPVVAVSANAMDADVASGLAAGFFDYITKPLELQRLLKVVQSALAASGAAAA